MTPQLETLYRKHAPAILRFAWGLSGDRATAEDLVAETFYRLLVKAPRIETTTALAYLLAITRNTWLTSKRRTNREVPLTEELVGEKAFEYAEGLTGCEQRQNFFVEKAVVFRAVVNPFFNSQDRFGIGGIIERNAHGHTVISEKPGDKAFLGVARNHRQATRRRLRSPF